MKNIKFEDLDTMEEARDRAFYIYKKTTSELKKEKALEEYNMLDRILTAEAYSKINLPICSH